MSGTATPTAARQARSVQSASAVTTDHPTSLLIVSPRLVKFADVTKLANRAVRPIEYVELGMECHLRHKRSAI